MPEENGLWPGFDGGGKGTGDHACKVETSLLWALEPDCVDVSRYLLESRPSRSLAAEAGGAILRMSDDGHSIGAASGS